MEEREENINNEREEREILGKRRIIFFFLQYCYSAILKVELQCSSIAKNFAILGFLQSQILSTLGLEMPNSPYIWHLQSPVLML